MKNPLLHLCNELGLYYLDAVVRHDVENRRWEFTLIFRSNAYVKSVDDMNSKSYMATVYVSDEDMNGCRNEEEAEALVVRQHALIESMLRNDFGSKVTK